MEVPIQKQWDRRLESENETPKAYAGFCIYRDMGTSRSLDAAYRLAKAAEGSRKGGKRAATYWNKWSTTFHWTSRAAAYDDYQEKLRREATQHEELLLRQVEREEKSRLRKERLKILENDRWLDSIELRELARDGIQNLKDNPGKLSGAEVVKLLQQSEELRAKALNLVDMLETNAIAALVQSDLVPEEMIDFFSGVWEDASLASREGFWKIMSKHYPPEPPDREESLEETDQEELF